MEVPGIKNNLVDGVMDFEKHTYTWNADLPVPEESLYLRFQYKRTQEKDHQYFFVREGSNNDFNYANFFLEFKDYFSFSVFNKNERTRIQYNEYYDNYDDLQQFQWIGLLITKQKIELYFENNLVNTIEVQDENTLKYYTNIKYEINQKYGDRNNDAIGMMKNLQIFHNLSQDQLQCLKQFDYMATCPSEQYIDGICQQECIRKASSLQEVQIYGEGVYDYDNQVYNFIINTSDLQIPQCVSGFILDREGNNVNYEGYITNPNFTFFQQQIQNSCYFEGDIQICEFQYFLQVEDVIKVIFNVKSNLKNLEKVQNSVEFKGRFINQQKLSKGNLQFENQSGLTLYRDYQFEVQYFIESTLVFYSSSTFKHPLETAYSFGNDIYAQVQVSQDLLDQGFTLEFDNAYINGEDIGHLEITPSEIWYSEEGFLNLTFRTYGYLENTEISLEILYKVISNDQQEFKLNQFSSKTLKITKPKEKQFLTNSQQSIFDKILQFLK